MSANLIPILWESTLQTLYMVAMSTLLGTIIGAPLGIFLAPSRRGELLSAPVLNAVLGLIVSFLVGWGFLIGLVGVGLAIAALRRPWESRPIAAWALCLSILSLVYSGGWLWWASTQGPLFG